MQSRGKWTQGNAGSGTRTRTGMAPGILSPLRLPFRHPGIHPMKGMLHEDPPRKRGTRLLADGGRGGNRTRV